MPQAAERMPGVAGARQTRCAFVLKHRQVRVFLACFSRETLVVINDEEQLLGFGLLGEHRLHRSLREFPSRLGIGTNNHRDVKLTSEIVASRPALESGLRLEDGQSSHVSSAQLSEWLAAAAIA